MLVVVFVGAAAAGPQNPAEPAVPPVRLSPDELALYQRAHTLLEWSPAQIHDCPFLHKLQPAASQRELPDVLARVGNTCTKMLLDFPRVSADEEVFSELGPQGRWGSPFLRHHKFRYIVIPHPTGDYPGLEEYRTDLKGKALDVLNSRDFFMITSDFVSTWLFLSPADQRDSTFRYFGTQTIRKQECHVVGFAQDPERVHSVGVCIIRGKSIALLVQGVVWVDAETFQILRIKTWLLAPRPDIDLGAQITTVDFFPVQPIGTQRVLWLPRDVTVEAVYRGLPIRNTHHYSNFKLFRVESTIKPVG